MPKQENRCGIKSKNDVLGIALPILKGLEQRESAKALRRDVAELAADVEIGLTYPGEACEALEKMFGRKAVEKGKEIWENERQEVKKDLHTLKHSGCSVCEGQTPILISEAVCKVTSEKEKCRGIVDQHKKGDLTKQEMLGKILSEMPRKDIDRALDGIEEAQEKMKKEG